MRSTVFAPFVISGAAVGLAAQFVFDPHFGLIQDLLRRIGVGVPDFYQDARWALFMVTITYVWKNLGYTFVIYLAALQGVRRDLLEAAEIDGASRWAVFRRVLLPQLRPTTFFLSITVLINSLQVVRCDQRDDPGRAGGHRHHHHGVTRCMWRRSAISGPVMAPRWPRSCSWCCWP
ncbi:hypothetical protein MRGA327_17360 [Mycobacterium tuberculosis RGTB327]|nr:hypothetical protein MRGA327_17360 [Mycobacterium tuberculosis RGTB327]